MRHHADLLDAGFWQSHKASILAGHVHDVFPYDEHKRFNSTQGDPVGSSALMDATRHLDLPVQ